MNGLLAYLLLVSSMALGLLPNPQDEISLGLQPSLGQGTAGLGPALPGGNSPSFKGGFQNPSRVPGEPPAGQRCSGRNYGSRRCCTPSRPCNEGEGDCDGPSDGGMHDGHRGCKGDLQCGSNNCKKFGSYFHEKDDCCERKASPQEVSVNPLNRGVSHNPSSGGSNNPSRSGSHNPSNGGSNNPSSGGSNNPSRGGSHNPSKAGSNNPSSVPSEPPAAASGWEAWGAWRECTRECGGGTKSRIRYCQGPTCTHQLQHQDRPCNTHPCHQHWG